MQSQTITGSNLAINRAEEIKEILKDGNLDKIFEKIILILNESEEDIISYIKEYFDNFFKNYNENGESYKFIYIEELKILLKNLTRNTSEIREVDIQDLEETVFYDPSFDESSLIKFHATHQVFSIFPNIKSFYFQDLRDVGKKLFEKKISSIPNVRDFILNDQYNIVTRHYSNGQPFLLAISNGVFFSSPNKEFAELYPIIIKEIFEKTKILTKDELKQFTPKFQNEQQAQKFLILLYKLSRSGDLYILNSQQRNKLTEFFGNIAELSSNNIQKLDETLHKDQVSFDDLEGFIKEKTLAEKIRDFLEYDQNQTNSILQEIYSRDDKEAKLLKTLNLLKNNLSEKEQSFKSHISAIINQLDYLNDKTNEDILNIASLIFAEHEILHDQTSQINNIKKLYDLFTRKFHHLFKKSDGNNSVIILDQNLKIKLIPSSNEELDGSLCADQIKQQIYPIIAEFDDENYRLFFKEYFNNLLDTNYAFSSANITKENSLELLKMALLYNKEDLENNLQFKKNLTDFFEKIDRNTSQINGAQSDSSKILEALNSSANFLQSSNQTNIIKNKFQIFLATQALTANLGSSSDSRQTNSGEYDPAGGVFAMRDEENQVLDNIPQLPANFNQSPNYAHQLFLGEVLGDDFYSENFAIQAGQNLDQFIQHLFFNPNSEELRGLLGETRFNELQAKLSNSSLDCHPIINSHNQSAYFVTTDTLGNPGENKVGALLHDNALNIGIFNGVNLKLGLRINQDGSKEQGLFDNRGKLLIDHQSLIAMYEKSGMNSDSLVKAIASFGSLNNSGIGQSSYLESNSTTFSLRCLNGKWYLGIFQSKEGQEGQHILEFRGAIKINDIKKIIKIPKFKTQSDLDQTIQENRDEQGIKNLGEVNPTEWTTFRSDSGIENNPALTRTPSNISLAGSYSSSRISLDRGESNNSSIQDERQGLLSTGDEEDAPKAHCCCNLFSRVSKGLIRMQKQASPIIKALKSTNLSDLIKTFSRYR
jgi:hypothetical protein